LQRKFRLTRSEDFKRVRRSGKSYAHPLVVLIVQSNEEPHVKVGIAAGRTVGIAVHRNRAKRLLREAMRSLLPKITSNLELVLIARPGLATATLEDTYKALLNLFGRAQILIATNES
jgi:ribonuclease P protein component